MSKDFVQDIHSLYQQYGFLDVVKKMNEKEKREFMNFRINFLEEELNELKLANNNIDKPETVDALIDLIVVSLGTLELFQVDIEQAWNEVLKANQKKEIGMKESRKNTYGFPDLVKPEDWTPPDHIGNTGII